MKKIISSLIILLLILSISSYSKELSLHEAFTLAEQHSNELKKASAERSAYASLASAVKAERFPTIDVTGLVSYKDEIPSLDIETPGFTLSREIGVKETYQTEVQVSVPLYTGGKLSSGIDRAEASVKLYEALEKMNEDQVAYYTRSRYLQLARADQMVVTAEASLTRTRLIVGDVRSMYDAGTVDSTALLEAQLAYNSVEIQLEGAKTARRNAEINLLVLLGLELSEPLVLTDKSTAPVNGQPEFTKIAESKPELMAARSMIEMNMASLQQSNADYFPTIGLFGKYSYGKPNQDIFNGEFNDYFMAGVNLSWSFNIGGKTKHSNRFNQYSLKASEHEYDHRKERLYNQANISAEQVKLAYRQYETAEKNYTLSSRNYELAKIQHAHGALPTNRLLEIEQELAKAESSRVIARIDYYLNQSQLYYITGNEKLKGQL